MEFFRYASIYQCPKLLDSFFDSMCLRFVTQFYGSTLVILLCNTKHCFVTEIRRARLTRAILAPSVGCGCFQCDIFFAPNASNFVTKHAICFLVAIRVEVWMNSRKCLASTAVKYRSHNTNYSSVQILCYLE